VAVLADLGFAFGTVLQQKETLSPVRADSIQGGGMALKREIRSDPAEAGPLAATRFPIPRRRDSASALPGGLGRWGASRIAWIEA
jgi:hypothetical protein